MLEALWGILLYSFTTATPIALAAVGETMLQRTGRVNLGLEGFIALGASVAVATTVYTRSPEAGLLLAALAGALFSLSYVALAVCLNFNQFASGLLVGFLGLGLADIVASIPERPIGIPLEAGSPARLLVQLAPIALALLAVAVLEKTWLGVEIKAVGSNPRVARERGLRVGLLRTATSIAGGALAGIAGAYLSLAVYGGKYWSGLTGGIGWVALGCVILGYWNPLGAVLAAYLIWSLRASRPYLDDVGLPGWVADVSPYVATILVLCVVGVVLKLRPQLKPPVFEV